MKATAENRTKLHLEIGSMPKWMSNAEILARHNLYPEVNMEDDDYAGIKLSHPAGWEVIFVEIVRDEVNGSYATLAVGIEDFKKYSRIISSSFHILEIE